MIKKDCGGIQQANKLFANCAFINLIFASLRKYNGADRFFCHK